MKKRIYSITGILLLLLGISASTDAQVKMQLTQQSDKKTYLVSLLPERTYDFPNEMVGSVQLTLKVPKGNDFILSNITTQIEDVEWMRNNTLENEPLTKNYNYYSLGVLPLGSKVRLEKNKPLPLFTFQNSGSKTVKIELMDNNDEILPIVEKRFSLDMENNVSIHKRNMVINGYAGNVNLNTEVISNENGIIIDQVFPNPSKDIIKIKWTNALLDINDVKIMIVDNNGIALKTQNAEASIGENNNEINVGDLNEGTYLLQIRNTQKNITKSHKVFVIK